MMSKNKFGKTVNVANACETDRYKKITPKNRDHITQLSHYVRLKINSIRV